MGDIDDILKFYRSTGNVITKSIDPIAYGGKILVHKTIKGVHGMIIGNHLYHVKSCNVNPHIWTNNTSLFHIAEMIDNKYDLYHFEFKSINVRVNNL